jgi:serine/threonine protein kinase
VGEDCRCAKVDQTGNNFIIKYGGYVNCFEQAVPGLSWCAAETPDACKDVRLKSMDSKGEYITEDICYFHSNECASAFDGECDEYGLFSPSRAASKKVCKCRTDCSDCGNCPEKSFDDFFLGYCPRNDSKEEVSDNCITDRAGVCDGPWSKGEVSDCSCFNDMTDCNYAPEKVQSNSTGLQRGSQDGEDSGPIVASVLVPLFVLAGVAAWAVTKRRETRAQRRAFDFETKIEALRASGDLPAEVDDDHTGYQSGDGGTTVASLSRGIPRELKRRCISRMDKIGSGAFGEVFKGILDESLTNGIPGYMVACKSVVTAHGGGGDDLYFEATVMAQVGFHSNLVSLIGVVTAGLPLLLVVSFCEFGSLLSLLQKHARKGAPLTLEVKLKLACDTNCGMVYLCSRHFIHRDLAARNVLVASGMVAKVADFGLSRSSVVGSGNEGEGAEYYRSNNGVFPVRWTPPEAMDAGIYSQASDVWAFGILLVEIVQDGAPPYGMLNNSVVMTKVIDGFKHGQPVDCPDDLFKIMCWCWSTDTKERPPFVRLVAMLESLMVGNIPDCLTASADGEYIPIVGGTADAVEVIAINSGPEFQNGYEMPIATPMPNPTIHDGYMSPNPGLDLNGAVRASGSGGDDGTSTHALSAGNSCGTESTIEHNTSFGVFHNFVSETTKKKTTHEYSLATVSM